MGHLCPFLACRYREAHQQQANSPSNHRGHRRLRDGRVALSSGRPSAQADALAHEEGREHCGDRRRGRVRGALSGEAVFQPDSRLAFLAD